MPLDITQTMNDKGAVLPNMPSGWYDFMREVVNHIAHYYKSGQGIGDGRCFAACPTTISQFSRRLIMGSSGEEIAIEGEGMFAKAEHHAEREAIRSYWAEHRTLPSVIFIDLAPCPSCSKFLATQYSKSTLKIYCAQPYPPKITLGKVHMNYKNYVSPRTGWNRGARLNKL